MSITQLDELQHVASDDWLWRESLYFDFHDAGGKIAGTTTVRLADQPELVLLTIAGLLGQDESPAVLAEAARQVGLRALQVQ